MSNIKEILSKYKSIAMIGVSNDPTKASTIVMKYMQKYGYKVIPVNPKAKGEKILGEEVFEKITDIKQPVGIVDVFRPSKEAYAIAEDAVKIGAKVLWLQLGIRNENAKKLVEKNDIEYRLSDSVAYLGLKSFESRRERKYKRVINSFFKKLERKGISNVILDVRGNRGGYVLLLEHVLSYINAKGETFDLNYLYKRSKLDRFETLSRFKKLDFVKKALRVYPQGMISKEYDFYKSPMGSMSSILYQKKLTNPLGMTYTGKCALLTDGLSMSASVLLASWFKGHNRGQVIGTPCFGSMQGLSLIHISEPTRPY